MVNDPDFERSAANEEPAAGTDLILDLSSADGYRKLFPFFGKSIFENWRSGEEEKLESIEVVTLFDHLQVLLHVFVDPAAGLQCSLAP